MIVELLGMLGGGVFRLLPELIKLVTAKRDAEHEYRMTQLQLQIDQARAGQQIDLVHAQGAVASDAAEMAAMLEALRGQAGASGNAIVDALNTSVRPVLTYWWCLLLYTAAKALTLVVAVQDRADLATLAGLACTEFDRAVIGSILSFWFVDRSLRRGKA